MEDAFPACKRNDPISDDVLNFVTGCLNIVPGKRPTAQKLLDHKLFGGIWQYTDSQVDIWTNKGEDFFCLLFLFNSTTGMK